MTLRSAATALSVAASRTQDPGIRQLALGLEELAGALARELDAIKAKMNDIENEVSRINSRLR